MIIFKHKTKNILVSTNYKVMFSSLNQCHNLEIITKKEFLRSILFFKIKYYILTRNPYNRIFSFYNDKFLKQADLNRSIQDCQKIFLPFLNIDFNVDSKSLINERIKNVSFNKFISFLPDVFRKDGHLQPQTDISTNIYNTFKIPLKSNFIIPFKIMTINAKLIKMENKSDLNNLGKEIDLDVKKKYNSTIEYPMPNINKTSINIIKTIYEKDFEYLGYEKDYNLSNYLG